MATAEPIVHDGILTAMESLVIMWLELAIKSVNASSGLDPENFVFDSSQRDSSGNMEGLQMTASSRINSNTDLNRIDETRGNITLEVGELSVNRRRSDR